MPSASSSQESFQQSSLFGPKPESISQKEVNNWIETHNNKYTLTTQNFKAWGNTTFSSALNTPEVRQNAIFMLRGFLAQQMKKSVSSKDPVSKRIFIKILLNEIKMKKTNLDSSVLVRDALMFLNSPR